MASSRPTSIPTPGWPPARWSATCVNSGLPDDVARRAVSGLVGRGSHPDRMLSVALDTIRLFVHVLAATVWVGGQLTLAGLVPGLRALGPDVPRTVARRFNRIAWPAFGVLFLTGLWNLSETHVGN